MILDKIIKSTEERIENKKNSLSFEDLKNKINNNNKINNKNIINDNNKNEMNLNEDLNHSSFEKALKNSGMSFICEVKRASPSKGMICHDFDPVKIAMEYELGGASAISVLTEPHFFKGSDTYLKNVVANVNLPVLRKDFIIDEYMIYEAKLLGAHAVLLITSILDTDELKEFIKLSYNLGISPLVETHTTYELEIAIDAGAKIIGVNNRNLKDFTVDINNTISLQKSIPEDIRKDIVFISESGIKTPEDVKILDENNIDAVLIGESLMRSDNKKLAIGNLKSLI